MFVRQNINRMNRLFTPAVLFFCLWAALPLVVSAQEEEKDKKKGGKAFIGKNSIASLMNKGIAFFEADDYEAALPFFEDVMEKAPAVEEAMYHAAICHMELESPKQALEYFEYLSDKGVAQEPAFHYWLGRAYYQNMQFDKAIKELTTHLNKHPKIFPDELKHLLSYAKYAKAYYAAPKPYKLENVGIGVNTESSEFSPTFSSDFKTLFFTRRKAVKNGGETGEVLMSKLDDLNQFGRPAIVKIDAEDGAKVAALQLYAGNGKMVVYYQGDLYISEWQGNRWGKPAPISEALNIGKETSAFLSGDEKTIIFSATPTDLDHSDLFISRRDSSGWTVPQPIADLNTPERESSPFLDADGTLYFSSAGHTSMGRLDVFSTRFDPGTGKWSTPENLGYPVNSTEDDYGFSVREGVGYLSSARPGGYGKEDIYRVYMFDEVEVTGTIADQKDKIAIEGAVVKFVDEDGREYTATTDAAGNYTVKVPFNKNYKVKVMQGDKVRYEDTYEPKVAVTKGSKERGKLQKGFYIVNDDSGDAAPVATNNPNVSDLGDPNDPANPLSPKFSGKKEHTGKGTLLRGQAFSSGNRKPMANAKVEVLDRRTKKVLFTTTTNDKGQYEVELPEGDKDYLVRIHGSKHLTETREVRMSAARKGIINLNVAMSPATVGRKYIIPNIYFASNSALIREVSYPSLDKVVTFIKENPNLKIEIVGHTDSFGSGPFNQELSLRRAKSIVNYLTSKGVPKESLIAIGKGETEPMASNDDESDGRELNRRIELKIAADNAE